MHITVVTAVTAGAMKLVGKTVGFIVSSTLPLIVDYGVALIDRTC